MNRITTIRKRLRIFQEKKDDRETLTEWPFFIILTLVFAFVYVQSLLSNAALREPLRLVIFTVLMNVHIVLHWLSSRLQKWSRVAVYLVVQCVLAFVIVYMAGNIGALLGLYMGLIGETIGMLREKLRWMVTAIPVLLGLSFLNYILQVGNSGWYWWLLAILPSALFVAVYVTLYSRQAEARQQAQFLLKDLETANRQLSEYAARVEDLTIANERQRMARELHDTLSQGLAGLILQLEAADAHLAENRPERARSILGQSMETARETLAEARQAIDNLRQPVANDLAEAAKQEVERFISATGIHCELFIEIRVDIPAPLTETAARAISEGLTNIARHARANNAQLRIVSLVDSKELEIEIVDDGIGFAPASVEAGHYGLLGMRERVRMVGGNMDVRSEPGKGTRIVIRFPLGEPVHD